MSDYRLWVNGDVELEDYSTIHDYIGVIGKNDKLEITINKMGSENIDVVQGILKYDNFQVISKRETKEGNCLITACKGK